MPDAMWITCTAGCGGDMRFQPGDPPSYVCQQCGHVQQSGAFNIDSTGGSDADGIIGDLGLYEDLMQCVLVGDPWVEYGIIEFRYRLAYPGKFRDLVRERGHRQFPVGNNTASKLIGQALGILAERGSLVKHVGGAGTGFWRHNDPSHWYARPPAPPISKLVTWTGYLAGELDGEVRDEQSVMSEAAIRDATPN
jgi:hypothetical protein